MEPLDLVQGFIFAFSAVFLMEMGDKTQITAFTLSVRYRNPLMVFLGVTGGLTGVTFIAVIIGLIIRETIDITFLKPLIALIFILGGFLIMIKEIRAQYDQSLTICPVSLDYCEKPREECPEIASCNIYKTEIIQKGAFLSSLTFMFLAELGDKTMIMGAGLVTQFNPLGVFIGALTALIIINGIGVFLGEKIANRIPRKKIGIISGILFVLTGILVLFL